MEFFLQPLKRSSDDGKRKTSSNRRRRKKKTTGTLSTATTFFMVVFFISVFVYDVATTSSTILNQDDQVEPLKKGEDDREGGRLIGEMLEKVTSEQKMTATTTQEQATKPREPAAITTKTTVMDENVDTVEDSLFDPVQADPDCIATYEDSDAALNDQNANQKQHHEDCWHPPDSTIEQLEQEGKKAAADDDVVVDQGDSECPTAKSPLDDNAETCKPKETGGSKEKSRKTETEQKKQQRQQEKNKERQEKVPTGDKHWGSDPSILRMRDQLRRQGLGISKKFRPPEKRRYPKEKTKSGHDFPRPPIFLMPGLASTRLVAWRKKPCLHPLLSDVKVQDYVWLNLNLIMQMSTIEASCMRDCLKLGQNQTDSDEPIFTLSGLREEDDVYDDTDREGRSPTGGCKLRPDEGLDAISSLSPGGIGSQLLVGGTNTVYAWLIQWLADNLGYDVTNIIGLPYDWRLSPDKMQARDGFLTLTRRRLEAAVQTAGRPGIMVAHSMGNLIFRYFLEWLRTQLRQEAYEMYVKRAKRRKSKLMKSQQQQPHHGIPGAAGGIGVDDLPGWMTGIMSELEEDEDENVESDLPKLEDRKHAQLWELAQMEGDDNWLEWIETHIWTYVGLSAPMLGAVNPLRAVISGENMGVPVDEKSARVMELSFGSTHTVNPVSTKDAFCDEWSAERWDEEPDTKKNAKPRQMDARLACLDDIYTEIEYSSEDHDKNDPWDNFPALKAYLKERRDWNSDFDMIKVVEEHCGPKEKIPCAQNRTLATFGPKDVANGNIFTGFSELWKERDEPLIVKREQMRESFWDTPVTNPLNHTWERPLIKHVIMAYGIDIPTEVSYVYSKTHRNGTKSDSSTSNDDGNSNEYDGIPNLQTSTWELAGGRLEDEGMDVSRASIADLLVKKKRKLRNRRQGNLPHSGDGSVPYLSLAWAHTWLLHAVRAVRYSNPSDDTEWPPRNPLTDIEITHRPKGGMEWLAGPPPQEERTLLENKKIEESSDTGTTHPHGTKYKPEMVRYHNKGTSRTTGIEYTTTVIEAIGIEHKEATRNYDILAAVFTDVLKFMHDDM